MGSLAVLSLGLFVQMNCSSSDLAGSGTGGNDGSGTGGQIGTGGQGGAGRCLDGPTGEGGSECGPPRVAVVDANTGALICDPTFTVAAGDAGMICDPTGRPTPMPGADGAATCVYELVSLRNVELTVQVDVAAPGYRPRLGALIQGCDVGSLMPTKIALVPITDGGDARDAGGAQTNCAPDGGGGDCTRCCLF